MAHIYVITNKKNNRQYVGKTINSIKERFREHINESHLPRASHRPLYDAMNKYGIDNFSIEELEECDIDIVDEREKYWINKLNTYHNGYNATFGGDGKILYDYKLLAEDYLKTNCLQDTAKKFHCDRDTVKRACYAYNIPILTSMERQNKINGTKVYMLDKKDETKIIKMFDSAAAASRFLGKGREGNSHILEAARGDRKSAYGYKWKYA